MKKIVYNNEEYLYKLADIHKASFCEYPILYRYTSYVANSIQYKIDRLYRSVWNAFHWVAWNAKANPIDQILRKYL